MYGQNSCNLSDQPPPGLLFTEGRSKFPTPFAAAIFSWYLFAQLEAHSLPAIFPKISTPVLENQLNNVKTPFHADLGVSIYIYNYIYILYIYYIYVNLQLPPNLVCQTPPASERPWSFGTMLPTCPWYQHLSSASALPRCQRTRPTSGPLVQLPWFHGRFRLQSPSSLLVVYHQHEQQ